MTDFDEERRDIAEYLMHLSTYSHCQYCEEFVELLVDTVMDPFNPWSFRSMFEQLAELIDRPTTRNVATDKTQCHAPQDFACERCGYWTPVNIGFRHCPNCGAKVVDE